MRRSVSFLIPLLSALLPGPPAAGAESAVEAPASGETDAPHIHPAPPERDWLTGDGVNLGGMLFPHFHFNAVYGSTTAENGEPLGDGHSAPRRDGWTIQGFEPGISLRAGEHIEAFAGAHIFYDHDDGAWDGALEEWFGKAKDLPFGLELRGGKFLNRFGLQNTLHLHGWEFPNNNLVNERFLGDEGLATIGGEITWALPVDSTTWTSLLTVSVGDARRDSHGHAEEENDEDEQEFEGAGAAFDSILTTANWSNRYRFDDFHEIRAGMSGAWGENVWGLATSVYGLHFEYQWRENGLEPGGRYFRWRTEGMLRHFSARSGRFPGEKEEAEQPQHASSRRQNFTGTGASTSLVYGLPTSFAGPIEIALRADYVGGESSAGLAEQWRVTPGMKIFLNSQRSAFLGAFYQFDHASTTGDDHSVWLHMGVNWGGPEVR